MSRRGRGMYVPMLITREEIIALDRTSRGEQPDGGLEALAVAREAIAKLEMAFQRGECVQVGGVNRCGLTELWSERD